MDELKFYNGLHTGQQIDEGIDNALRDEIVQVNFSGLTGTWNGGVVSTYNVSPTFPWIETHPRITSDHIVLAYWFSNPSAVIGDCTVETGSNSVKVSFSGTLNGTTDLTLILGKRGMTQLPLPE